MPKFYRFVLWLIGLCLVGFAMFGRVVEGPGDVAKIVEIETYAGQYPSLLFAVVAVSLLLFSEAMDLAWSRVVLEGVCRREFLAERDLFCLSFQSGMEPHGKRPQILKT